MANVQTLIRHAELDAETLSAIIRAIVFLSLAIVVLSSGQIEGPGVGGWAAIVTYGAGAAVGLFLAWRRIFHPVIPYLFVTLDVILVIAHVQLLAGMMRLQPSSAFALPAAALIFVILIHASMRYRPWLVVYAAVLFVAAIEISPFILPSEPQPMMSGMMPMVGHGMMGLLNYQILPVTLIALAAFILFVTVRRTRNLLLTSIQHVARTARLSRYFSPNLAARLAEEDDEETLLGRRQSVAVLFVDIRGFTALGETMAPDELGAFLSEYRNRLAQPVFTHGGTVDKFIGDAIMAVFGSPIQQANDARCALDCAFEILDAARRWSLERERVGLKPVAIGVGAHYGEVFAGVLGSDQLLEYTVIGDTVNIAERLEGMSREVDSPLVISAALLEATGDVDDLEQWRRLAALELRGRRKTIEAFCLARDLRTSLAV